MTATTADALAEPTLEDLERALCQTIDALVRHRAVRDAQRPTGERRLVTFSAQQLGGTPDAVLDQRGWVSDPVDRGLKVAIRAIGRHLARRLGSMDALGDLVERVAEADGDGDWSHRITVLDKTFDGIRCPDGAVWTA